MNTKNKRLIQVIIVSLLLLIVGGLISRSNIQAGTNELPQWESRFVLPGVNAQVSAITSHNGTIYLGGEFTAVDGQQSAYVASWDGTQFTPMAGLNGDVSGLTVDPTGDLYAVGRFTDSGANADANYVARWTGSSWMAVGSSVQGVVNTILATNNQLYIGGDFTAINGNANAAHIARWDGTTWQALDVGLNGPVYTLAGAENGDLYVGGDFTDAGYQADADYLAIWKNDAWKPVAAGINDSVHALAVDGGTLYVGGQFVDAASIAEADYLVRWKDDQWTPLGDTPLTGAVNALTVDASGNLLVGGTFVNGANLADADYVAQWDGTTWSVVGGGLMGAVNALHVSNDHIYLGGTFNDIDGIPYGHHFVSWQDNGWVMPAAITGMGLNGTVQTMLEAADGSIIVGGEFADAGGVEAADHIALWDGQQWSALANGLNSNVYALAHDSVRT